MAAKEEGMGVGCDKEHEKPLSERKDVSDSLVMPLGMSKTPMGWPVMEQAYIDFAMWALAQPGFLKAFEVETGIKYRPPRNRLEKMIDDATDSNKHIIAKFLDWITVNHWGES